MQDYDRKYLKNLFAEHNVTNMDYLNSPELLAASLADINLKGNSTDIIKQAVTNNSKLMSVPYIANNKAIKGLNPESSSDDQSSSTHNVKQTTLSAFDSRIKLSAQVNQGLPKYHQNRNSSSKLEELKGKHDLQVAANPRTLSKVIEENVGKDRLMSDTNLARPTTGHAGKHRNIFSATTNANSQGTKLRSRLAGKE